MDTGNMITFREVQRLLGISSGFLEYHGLTGEIPEAEKWGDRRYFRPETVEVIRVFLAGRTKGQHRPRAEKVLASTTRKEVE